MENQSRKQRKIDLSLPLERGSPTLSPKGRRGIAFDNTKEAEGRRFHG